MLRKIPNIAWVPLLALLSAGWIEERPTRTSGLILFTQSDGSDVLLHASHVYAVHESDERIGKNPLTRILVLGRKALDVRQSVQQVMRQLAGDWVQLHLAQSRKPVFVDVGEISTVHPSVYRRGSDSLSYIQFVSGTRLRVAEPITALRTLLNR